MSNSDQGHDAGRRRLGGLYSAALAALGGLTSLLAVVQLWETENALLITLLLAAVLTLAGAAVYYVWGQRDGRVRWLGTITIVILVLASLGVGYNLGRANTAARQTSDTQAPQNQGKTNNDVPVGAPSTAQTTAATAGLRLSSKEPAAKELGTFGELENSPATLAGTKYDEAIVVSLLACSAHPPRWAEYVIDKRYTRLTGKVGIADDSPVVDPLQFTLILDNQRQPIREIASTEPLTLDVPVSGVLRIRFEFKSGGECGKSRKLVLADIAAQP